jgi:hypothetical protein
VGKFSRRSQEWKIVYSEKEVTGSSIMRDDFPASAFRESHRNFEQGSTAANNFTWRTA